MPEDDRYTEWHNGLDLAQHRRLAQLAREELELHVKISRGFYQRKLDELGDHHPNRETRALGYRRRMRAALNAYAIIKHFEENPWLLTTLNPNQERPK